MDNTSDSPDTSRRYSTLLSQLPTLQTGLTVTINTRDAALFWESNRLHWRLAALSRIWQAQKGGNPWADERLFRIEQIMLSARTTLSALQETLDGELKTLPPGVAIAAPDFTQGVSLGQQSACPPVGFFITLFAQFNHALLTLLQVRMTGLQDVAVTDGWRRKLYQAMRSPLHLLLPGQELSAAHSSVTRIDLLQSTPLARQWLSRTTMPSVDILTGDSRSRWQSPLNLPVQLVQAIRDIQLSTSTPTDGEEKQEIVDVLEPVTEEEQESTETQITSDDAKSTDGTE